MIHCAILGILKGMKKCNFIYIAFALKVGRVVRNKTFVYKGLTMTWLVSHPTLKACNSPYMQYYFNRFFVLHFLEVIFSFLIKMSRQNAIEIKIAFFHSPWESQGSHIG